MPEAKLRVGVLASGRGSNLQAIIDAIEAGKLLARIAVVISNKKDAQALERARRHGVADVFLDPAPYKDRPDSREAYDRAVLDILRKHNVELVALAGYMKIVTRVLIDAYPNRIMNIHPALLPSFPGLNAQQQALAWGVKVSGCTVHFVTEGWTQGRSSGKRPCRSKKTTQWRLWKPASWRRSIASIPKPSSSSPTGVSRSKGGACASASGR